MYYINLDSMLLLWPYFLLPQSLLKKNAPLSKLKLTD